MRRALTVVEVGLVLIIGSSCVAEASSPQDREVIAMLRQGLIQLPAGVDSGTVSEAQVNPAIMLDTFSTHQVEMVSRSFPDFSPAETLFVSPQGDTLTLTNWSNLYTLRVASGASPESLAAALRQMDGVEYAELNGLPLFGGFVYPNDSLFVNREQWAVWNSGQGGEGVDADIDGPEAWQINTGNSVSGWIGIVDAGVSATHEDLQGRVSGDFGSDFGGHGSLVAGVIGAKGNNGLGMAGVDWNSPIVSRNIFPCGKGTVCVADQIRRAGIGVLNLSWIWTKAADNVTPDPSPTIRRAILDGFKQGGITVAMMGNTGTATTQYPAGFGRGIIAVGGTTRRDERWSGSSKGTHMDVCAPAESVITTNASGSYSLISGTSFATAHVSGVASLIRTTLGTAYIEHDDVENLLRLAADHLGDAGHNDEFGWGRVNAQKTLRLLMPPNTLRAKIVSFGGGQLHGAILDTTMQFFNVPGLNESQTYTVRRHEVRKFIAFTPAFTRVPTVWGCGASTVGFSTESPNPGVGWCEPVGAIGVNGCTMRTYVYEVYLPAENRWTFYPSFSGPGAGGFYAVQYGVRGLEIAPVPDLSQSFYVPQAGNTTTPIEGLSSPNPSYRFFRTCPNNDGGASLPNSARIKIVVKDAAGNGIQGIQRGDIFILLNGGTPAQGFVGDGADSVISNVDFNPSPACPDFTVIEADTSTDAAGETYITFTGRKPGEPGVGQRDPSRKWGHYDSELPVYVLGQKIAGRLTTTGSENGSYTLRIKNFDQSDGLGTTLNRGTTVTSADFNYFNNHYGHYVSQHPGDWWLDFDGNGQILGADWTAFTFHVGHDCNSPNDP